MFDEIMAQFDEIFEKIQAFFTEIQETLMNLFASYDAGENTTYESTEG